MKHVNPSFSIQAPKINFDAARLFAEAGPTGVSLAVLDANNIFKVVVVYSFPAGLTGNELNQHFKDIFSSENLLQRQYSRLHIFWSFPQSILVPAELMNEDRNGNMLNLVFGDAEQGTIKSDFLYRHNLHNVYRIPQTVIDNFNGYFPLATQTHVFTAMVNRVIAEGNHLYTVFYSNSLTIMLCKEGRLQVIQNFIYTGPEDCVFHLLNVCKGFDVPQAAVSLHISGMIDEQSVLYAAIYKYFLQVQFDELPAEYGYDEAIKEHPQHFFSHLFALPACV